MVKEYLVKKPVDFQTIIKDIFTNVKLNPLVIALEGDLGVGKTTFTKELGSYLGVSEVITSPTFIIMKQYELKYDTYDKLVHLDAYRIETEAELKPLGLTKIFTRPNTIMCVEWPNLISGAMPTNIVRMMIKIMANETRLMTVEYPSTQSEK